MKIKLTLQAVDNGELVDKNVFELKDATAEEYNRFYVGYLQMTGHSDKYVEEESKRDYLVMKKYFKRIGSKGDKKSKRTITPEQQAKMQKARKKDA